MNEVNGIVPDSFGLSIIGILRPLLAKSSCPASFIASIRQPT
ncbi:MAG: hypothetical protein NTV43_18315 [Methylococcales bacterium]|nr:hypothetical protein [Methylococcales bacterium]